MAGTKEGGQRARDKNLANDPNFYKRIGSLGGIKTRDSGQLAKVGFASNIERAKIAGAKGGSISRRGPSGKNARQ